MKPTVRGDVLCIGAKDVVLSLNFTYLNKIRLFRFPLFVLILADSSFQ